LFVPKCFCFFETNATPAESLKGGTFINYEINMSTMEKYLIIATLVGAVGPGIYEAHRASLLQEQTKSLLIQQDSLTWQLQNERAQASNGLTETQQRRVETPRERLELIKLRAAADRLRPNGRELAQWKAETAPNNGQKTADPSQPVSSPTTPTEQAALQVSMQNHSER
jgi:hypothetical protein